MLANSAAKTQHQDIYHERQTTPAGSRSSHIALAPLGRPRSCSANAASRPSTPLLFLVQARIKAFDTRLEELVYLRSSSNILTQHRTSPGASKDCVIIIGQSHIVVHE